MDEAGGSVMRDLSGSGLDGAIGSAVVPGGGTYRFPGWSQNVDPSGRLTGRSRRTRVPSRSAIRPTSSIGGRDRSW